MKRRSFLKLIGAVVLAPSLPVLAVKSEWGWFKYKGYRFRKDFNINYACIQLYTEVKICGKRYCNDVLIDKEDYKYRDMYLDNMIYSIERMKRKMSHPVPLQAPESPVSG